MLVLCLRTDRPEAEIILYSGTKKLATETWTAHRQLAETIHSKINALLSSQAKNWSDLKGIVVYQGPGSFTGLRIGISVANALGYAYNIPVAGVSGSDWPSGGLKMFNKSKVFQPVLPDYGAPVHITPPK